MIKKIIKSIREMQRIMLTGSLSAEKLNMKSLPVDMTYALNIVAY
jgi:hypothetical protein